MRRLIFPFIILLLATSCFALQKNVASQKWVVFAFDRTDNTPKAGDKEQITAEVSIDGVAGDGLDDTEPVELEDGYYVFDLSQAETNGDYIVIMPESSTSDIQVVGVPWGVWTTAPYFSILSIDSNGRLDIIKVAGTAQTANDNGADINAILTDTEAQDSATELRTLLTGADTPVCKDSTPLTAAEVESEVDDSIGGGTGTSLTAINLPDQTMNIVGNITGNLSGSVGTLTGGVDLVKIHGSAITETTSGMFAANWETFWDNADAATSKVVDNVGASAAGGGSPLVLSVGNVGNFKEDATIVFAWRTIDQGGAAVDPSVAGTIKIYKEDSDVEVTAPTGMTDTRGFDGITGVHLLVIDLGANTFYERNKDYSVVLTGATVDSQTATAVIATFSIEKRYVDEFERN